ncbi:hypothetical protein SEPCBS57363_003399 [Sporothrix epigloea]|uniref:N-acetyltransferase B complex non catalytic subunit-domain-containing protein n=1 Tax=Sporothrix epigloea TaxID=1892477 RepID=A0ABP0DL92_9PEZI
MSYVRQPRHRPPLKNGVDMQLQSAFAEQNWTIVIRLAEKRFKTSNDIYFQALRAVGQSRLDGVADRAAAVVLVDQWVRSNVTPDLEAIGLLEWACEESLLKHQYDKTYSESFGVLRARWVQANTRNTAAATNCLRSCLLAWDLVNAQKIATILDKSPQKHDRRYMFWAILLTHLLAGDASQPPSKRNIYGMLAQKQLEKAAKATEENGLVMSSTEKPDANDRNLHNEEEFLVYLRVLAAHGTRANYAQRALHPKAGAAVQFAMAGRKQMLDDVLAQLQTNRQWDAVFALCESALSSVAPSVLACDVRLWKLFVMAAQHRNDVRDAFDTVQAMLAKYVSSPTLPQMYRKNVGIAILQTTFSLPPSLIPEKAQDSSIRVEQLLSFVEAHLDKASLFNDVRCFVERLPIEEATDLLSRLESTPSKSTTSTTVRRVLVLKMRYLLATCPETRCPRSVLHVQIAETRAATDAALDGGKSVSLFEITCKICRNAAPAPEGCTHCLTSIATSALQLHRTLTDDEFFLSDILLKLDKDPRIDLSLVTVSVLIRLNRRLSAALILDMQHHQTPDDISIRLLLMRLSLCIGCSTHALTMWQPLGVKRSILDALGPLFYDRLSTISPGLFNGDPSTSRGSILEPVKQYFDTVLRQPSAVQIWDAFASGSYSSVLEMETYHTRLQQSATRAMAILEERRAARALGGRTDPVPDDLYATSLYNATDYGAFPNLESSYGVCLAERVCIGPGFSRSSSKDVVRLQLGILSERFLDIVTFKPPKEYKPSRPVEAVASDRAYAAESLARLNEDIHDLLHRTADVRAQLTSAEWAYYSAVSTLIVYTSTALDSAMAPPIIIILVQSLSASVDLIKKKALSASPINTAGTLFTAVSKLHSVGMLRETAIAIKLTVLFLAAYHDRELARNRSGISGLPREVLAGLDDLKSLATQALVDTKTYFKAIKEALSQSGLPAKLKDEVLQGDLSKELEEAVGVEAIDSWAEYILNGWRATLQGWMQVQMD